MPSLVRPVVLLVLVLLMTSCQPPSRLAAELADESTLVGQAFFPGYRPQATYEDVASAATVSLIDPTLNETKATSLTDSQGRFSLTFKGIPAGPQVYYLEALKGLGSNAVGKDAIRVRTLIQRRTGGWVSITSNLPGGLVTIDSSTTALCIITSLRKTVSPLNPEWLLGKVGVMGTGVPDTFESAGSSIGDTEYAQVFDLVSAALTADTDPFDAILYSNATYSAKPVSSVSQRLTIGELVPAIASAGQPLTIRGAGFAATPAGNTVTFSPGVTATVTSASSTSLQVTVPTGAMTGNLQVTVGTATATASFTYVPPVSGGLNP